MHRIFLIARRDYLERIKSKAYLFGLIIFPLLFGGSFLAIALANRANTREQRVALIDHTGVAAAAVIQTCEQFTRTGPANGGLRTASPQFTFEEEQAAADETAQLLSLSDRIRAGNLFLVIDISSDALRPDGDPKKELVRYYTNSTGANQLGWLYAAVNDGLRQVRLRQSGVDPASIPGLLRDVSVVPMNLLTLNPATGAVIQGGARNPIQAGLLAFFFVFLLVMVTMLGSAPNLGAVAEDKTERVFEMLLVSASPFELMAGKVLSAVGLALTSSTLYVAGGLMALWGLAMFGFAPLNLIPWFFVYLIGDVLMLSALGVALGSACGSPQDAQHLAFLIILPVLIPMLSMSAVMQQPNGPLATVMSFIPPFTPVLMLLRQALPGGVPWWQPWVGLAGISACAVAVIWAAARIFRIGILSQGKAPKLTELAEWVMRG
jgi:ABC-2 type transport system permease protein